MRNLKKVMALALATVMLLGIMVMGAGAADYKSYKDAAAVDGKYELAVEMMKEIGVFEGDNNGNLNAKNTLTRAEAAKVIATLKLTKSTASKIGAPIAAPFADVAADNWAAPYIAYAKDLGIISGVGDNKYDPAGTLTGYAFAKMLLVVLGNKADAEGYTGASWDTNVNLAALQAKLLENLSINLADAITREQAIQMAYNALMALTVSYSGGGSSVVLPDGTTINTSTGNRYNPGLTLLETLYGTTYNTAGSSSDEIGLPTKTWEKAGKIVAEAANYTVVKTYTGAIADVKASTIYADAGLSAATVVNVAVNTFDNVITTASLTKKDAATPVKPAADYNGATMKLIKVGTTYSLLIEYNELTKVTKVNKATADTKANVELANGLKIETEAYAEKDLLSITTGVNKDGDTVVLTHKKATIVTGKVTETTKTQVVVGGEKYAIAKALNGMYVSTAPALNGYADVIAAKTDVNFVIENGYIVGTTEIVKAAAAATLTNVYYLNGYTTPTVDLFGNATKYAQVIAMVDGTVSLVPVNAAAAEVATGELYTIKDVSGKTYKELKDFDGKTDIFETTLAETDKALKKADKAIDTAAGKAYITAGTMILNITGTGNELKAAYVAAPFDVALTDAQAASKVIYTQAKDKNGVVTNNDAGIIIIVGKINANADTTKVAYYALGDNQGVILGGKDGKEVLTKTNIIDLKTYQKIEVVTREVKAGFVDAQVVDGAYNFTAKTGATLKEVAASEAKLVMAYLTTADCTDYDTTNTVVVNVNSVKYDGKVISTVAELVASGKAFAMAVDNTKATVTYVIVK